MAANTAKKRRTGGNVAVPANGFTEMKDVISQMESFITEAEALATMEIRRIEEIKESVKASLARLAALFREREEILLTKERTTKELEENLFGKIRELEKQLGEKEMLLQTREEALKAINVRPAPLTAPPKGTPSPLPERAPTIRDLEETIRDLEEELIEEPQAGRRDGETEASGERAEGAIEPKGGRPTARELDTRAAKTDKGEAEIKGSRLVALLGPIKRKS
ncbi:MAG: hypothetical protein HYV04_14500 [Deltaproteobacteria bacterium]|nr:hypothetical protein [Deltaproteobacteria bacterium]